MNRKLNIVNIFFSMLIALTMILTSVKPIMALSSSPQSKRSDGDLRGGGYSQIGKFPFDGGGRILTQQVQNRIGALGGKFTANVLDIAEQFHTSLGILGRQLLIPTELTRYVDGISGVDVGDCQMIVSPCKSIQYAILHANAGDTIAVTSGTFKYVNVPGSGNEEYPGQTSTGMVIYLNKSLSLSGGWDNSFSTQTGLTVIDGEHARYGIFIYIYPVANSEINHFAIINSVLGIYKYVGDTTIKNSSIYYNDGAGISNTQLSLTVENVTISNNLGIGIANNGTATITNSTISDNGDTGFRHVGGNATIRNTIISGNAQGATSYDCVGPVVSGSIISSGNNIIGNTTGCVISAISGDQFNADPQLGVFLSSHGYQPLDATSPAIDNGNPAFCPALDQRGLTRSGACDIGAYEYYVPGPAASIWAEFGNNQRARIDANYVEPLTASVLDVQGNPVSGIEVTFTAPLSGPSGTFAGTSNNTEGPLVTNADGVVTTSVFTANSEYGSFTVQASADALGAAAFELENLAWKWYVTPTGLDSNSCKTPAEPCATISGALDKANPEDVIYLSVGTYTGTGLLVAMIQKSITISGGWNADFTARIGLSTIDGENARAGIEVSGPFVVNLTYLEIKNSKGSGIKNYQGTLTITNSSIHDNVYDGGSGAGIANMAGTLFVRNSTISNNFARYGGGIESGHSFSNVTLNSVTITGNHASYGGGIYNSDGAFSVKNSIIANNTADTAGPDCQVYPANAVISGGYNIVQTTCGAAQPTDRFNTDPKLGAFLPVQGYQPILFTSPAIDAGDDSCGFTDQRGVASVDIPNVGTPDVRCDIGAFEYIRNDGTPASVWIVSGDDQRTPPGTGFHLPLVAVVLDGQGNPVMGANVNFSAPSSGASAVFLGSGTYTEGPISTGADGAVTVPVRANAIGGTYVVQVDAGAGVTVNAVLTNIAWYVAPGGNDTNSCQSPVSPCVSMNGALGKIVSGDTIYVREGVYTSLTSSVVIISKDVFLSGGWNTDFTAITGYSTINGENIRRGVYVERTLTNIPIEVFVDRFIIQNGAATNGANVFNNAEALTITNSIIENGNGASGGLYSHLGRLMLDGVIVRNNRGTGSAGGISTSGSITTIANSVITGNMATTGAGGLSTSGIVNVINTTISGNVGMQGGGVAIGTTVLGLATFNNVTISGNYSESNGGGVYYSGSYSPPYPVLNNSLIAGNLSAGTGDDCNGYLSANYSIFGDSFGCPGVVGGTNLANLDPKLGLYLPTEGYHPLLLGSPAINAGNPALPGSGSTACAATDQRGIARNDARCDIGALEWKTAGPGVKIAPVFHDWRTPPNTPFSDPLQAMVLDALGNPAGAGLSLTFTSPSSGPSGIFANATRVDIALTDQNGIASTSTFTANGELGSYLVAVTGSGFAPADLYVSNFVWYVRTDGNDSNSCQTPASACLTVNKAIEKARRHDTIYVAEGVYLRPASDINNAVVSVTRTVNIIGGWNPSFTAKGNSTIIDGESIYTGIAILDPDVYLSRIMVKGALLGVITDQPTILDQMAIIDNERTGVLHDYAGQNSGALIIRNSTVSGNGEGGILVDYGTVHLINSTVAENFNNSGTLYGPSGGGGLTVIHGAVYLANSIIANNINEITPDCYVSDYHHGTLISNGNNIIGNTNGCDVTAAANDHFNVDPQLSPLIPYGYHALKSTSPALNAGNTALCTSQDQRGAVRLSDAKCDIGAYEHQTPGPVIEIFAIDPEVRRTPIGAAFQSRLTVVALDAAGTPVGGVVITLSAPISGPSGSFASSGVSESKVTDSNGFAVSSVITANGEYGDYQITGTSAGVSPIAFLMHNGAWLIANSGNNANDCLSPATPCADLAGILNKGDFNAGEVIWVAGGTYPGPGINQPANRGMTILGSWNPSFTGPGSATVFNGSTYFSGYEPVLIRGLIFTGYGVGNSGNLTLENSSIVQSEAGLRSSGKLTLINVTVTDNGTMHAALRINGGNVHILNSTISNNTGFFVGGIENDHGNVTLQNTIIAGNHAQNAGDGNNSVDCTSAGGSYVSAGYNIIGTTGGSNAPDCIATWLSTDLRGNNTAPINLSKIMANAPIADAATGQWYYPLIYNPQVANPAINKIPAVGYGCPATDQLGIPRPQSTTCDIGASEYIFLPGVSTLTAPVDKALITDFTPTLDWSDASPAPDHYEIQLASDANFTVGVKNYNSAISTYTLPDSEALSPNATYYWRVRGVNFVGAVSSWTAARSFRTALPPPNSLEPGNYYPGAAVNIHTRRPEFKWDVVPGATGYRLEVAAGKYCTTFSTKTLNLSVTTNSYTATKDLAAGAVYCWRVKATGANGPSGYSQARTFTTGNPPSVPKLNAPANNALMATTVQPTFDWVNSTLPTGTTFGYYEYQIDTTATFATATTFTTASSDITDSDLTPPTAGFPTLNRAATYYWRVRAWNTAGDSSGWTAPFSFRIAYDAPLLSLPANGAILLTLKPTFTWTAVLGATSYKIQVSTSPTFGTMVVNLSVSLPTYTRTTSLTAKKTYYWRVQALGTYGPSAWSAVWTFVTP